MNNDSHHIDEINSILTAMGLVFGLGGLILTLLYYLLINDVKTTGRLIISFIMGGVVAVLLTRGDSAKQIHMFKERLF